MLQCKKVITSHGNLTKKCTLASKPCHFMFTPTGVVTFLAGFPREIPLEICQKVHKNLVCIDTLNVFSVKFMKLGRGSCMLYNNITGVCLLPTIQSLYCLFAFFVKMLLICFAFKYFCSLCKVAMNTVYHFKVVLK